MIHFPLVDGRLMFLLSNSLFARIIIKISAIPGGSVMKNSEELRQQLRSINRKVIRHIKGWKVCIIWNYILSIDHAGRSFASPSHVSIQISHRDTGFPVEYYKDTLTGTTFATILHVSLKNRSVSTAFVQKARQKRPAHCQSLWSGDSFPDSLWNNRKGITARFFVGFPC